MKKDIENREDLYLFIDLFYQNIRADKEIGIIFNQIIEDWPAHLQKITGFWELHLWGTPAYAGNPLVVHNNVDKVMKHTITSRDFGTWLFHWMHTLDTHFEGKNVAVLKFKARKMQTMLFMNMMKNRHHD